MMVRLFQITGLSNQLMPTTSARWCIDSSREILLPLRSLIPDTKSSAETASRTNEDSSLCSLMRGERKHTRGVVGWLVLVSPIHPSYITDWHSSNYVFPDLSRLPIVPNIARRFHRALFRGLFSTWHLHPRRCHGRSCWNARVPEGYKLPSVIIAVDKTVSCAITHSRPRHDFPFPPPLNLAISFWILAAVLSCGSRNIQTGRFFF